MLMHSDLCYNCIVKLLRVFIPILILTGILLSIFLYINLTNSKKVFEPVAVMPSTYTSTVTPTVVSSLPKLKELPDSKTLQNDYHIFQTFNNCGPASLSMALSYYDVFVSQQVLGNSLRPYQVQGGFNDDKSVTLEELAKEAEKYGFFSIHRPNGSIEVIKKFISYDIPVITRTWLKVDDDIGHYRVVKGYTLNSLVQDDSLQGANLEYTFDDFNTIWNKFNYEYLVLIPTGKIEIAKAILEENFDKQTAWEKSLQELKTKVALGDTSTTTIFNLSVAYYNIGDYRKSVEFFEKVENDISRRTLWYQIEPIQAYYFLGEYDKALSLINKILNDDNRAFSELYIIRGDIYKDRGDISKAKEEYELAIKYNINLEIAKERLGNL